MNKPVTQAQKDLIEVMQEYGCELFAGKTNKEAAKWIRKHYKQFILNKILRDHGYF